MSEVQQGFWCSDELALQTLDFLPPLDLRNCAQVSRSFNRITVQSVLDKHKIWNPQQSAGLQLAEKPHDLDGLSALLLSIHVKSLAHVNFDLMKVVSLPSALKSFHKMKRLVDRMASVRTVYVHWPSDAYRDTISLSDKQFATACKCVEEFLSTVISRGCTLLQISGFNAFTSKYKLKKNPAIIGTLAEGSGSKPAVAEAPSIWGSAIEYLTYRQARASDLSVLSDEANYYRKSSRFSISAAPWISLTPSPTLSQVTKLTSFYAYSTNTFRPPFSQWTFSLLKESPVTFVTICFKDLPNDELESKLILDRLAEAVPDITAIYLDGARPGIMKDAVAWLGRFRQLRVLKIEPECFPAGTDIDDLDLQALARLPHIRTLTSSSSFLCAYIASRRSVDAGTLPRDLVDVIMRHIWTSSTRPAVSAFIKDVERLHNAIMEASPEPGGRYITLRINLRFNCFSDRAEALNRIWNQVDSSMLRRACDEEEASLEAPPCFRPSKSRPWLCLELHLTATVDEIQRGDLDEEVVAFCRLFPTLRKIMLCSPPAVSLGSRLSLRKERLDKFKSVCPELYYGWVY
ncbi:hypothetical protein EST38_g5551 [Candolleomyces aberdarensis]|uniref:F-box domain-containing protein n=1 Tax=Candolleomyces aberdarensis TaxID=2316362 RepID=A0A4Q2DMV6_9AGAR|nr:hypothetical protein EST38_g5551 [Candolleomyces aberdarensis]